MSSQKLVAIVGTVVHSVSFGSLELILNGAICHRNGIITDVFDLDKQPDALGSVDEVINHKGKLIMPGFVDAHCHAPQYVFSGTGMDLPLLEWLNKYTFPTEARFKDEAYARYAYEKAVRRHLKSGTTFCAYYGTVHLEASKVLAEIAHTIGQRAFVGKVNMDRNSPDFYIEETSKGCDDAEAFARYVLGLTPVGKDFLAAVDQDAGGSEEAMRAGGVETSAAFEKRPTLLNKADSPLVLPILTPRFVPTCTSEMMDRLGLISFKYGLPIQSHLSESIAEIAWVKDLHPDCATYAEVYNSCNLLHSATIMGHCCFSNDAERSLLRRKNATVVHCASSNFNLCSGVMDVRLFMADGIRVGLGTDVAGGHSASMLDCMRQSMVASRVVGFDQRGKDEASKTRSIHDEPVEYPPMTYMEMFHLATVGSAEALGMGDVVGNFKVGKAMDCLVVDTECENSPMDIFEHEGMIEKFQKFLFLGDDRNIESVYVHGKKVNA